MYTHSRVPIILLKCTKYNAYAITIKIQVQVGTFDFKTIDKHSLDDTTY